MVEGRELLDELLLSSGVDPFRDKLATSSFPADGWGLCDEELLFPAEDSPRGNPYDFSCSS